MENAKTPWHLWLVGIVALLWNGFGTYDYVMSQLHPETYLQAMGMNEAQIAAFHALPKWMTGVWAIGVWTALTASLLLLLRRRQATTAFVIALAAVLVSQIYTYGFSNSAANGPSGLVISGVLVTLSLFFVWYCRLMQKRGVLL
jgi:hypothetical protein